MKLLTYLIILAVFISCTNNRSVKFAVCADVHHDLIHDSDDRIQEFIQAAEKENVDFIIQLGDFCLPFEKNLPFLKIWNSFEKDKYHVMGNHDTDVSPKIITQNFWGMEKSFYSFDKGNFHFIVLDANFFKKNEDIIAYSSGNYFVDSVVRPIIPHQQIEWLAKDIAQTEKYIVVFLHQSLEHWGGVKNRTEILDIFDAANKESKKIIACFNGHDHQDRFMERNGIYYIGINSLSFAWVGDEFKYTGRFPKLIEDKFPTLKNTMPYREPVFALVTIKSSGQIKITGVKSDFIHPGPEELGMKNHQFSAKIENRFLEF